MHATSQPAWITFYPTVLRAPASLPLRSVSPLSAPESDLFCASPFVPSMSGSPQLGPMPAGVGTGAGTATQHRARVVWVGNVPQEVTRDELRRLLVAAFARFRTDVKVAHVQIQQQKDKEHNSATAFLNRSVDLHVLQLHVRAVAPQLSLKVRRCRNTKRQQQREQEKQRRLEQETALKSALEYLESSSTPLPDEIAMGTPVFDEFVQALEEDEEGGFPFVDFDLASLSSSSSGDSSASDE